MSKPSNPALAYADSPDPFRPPMLPIYSAKVDRPVNLVIVSPALVGAETHFFDGRTRPHVKPPHKCEGCDRRIDNRWKGYLGCWDRHKGRLSLAEVTSEAFKKCDGFKEYRERLRGMVIQLTRNGEAKTARVTAKLSLWTGPAGQLPAAFDVKEALERIWFTHDGAAITADEYVAGKRPEDARGIAGDLFGLPTEGPYGHQR